MTKLWNLVKAEEGIESAEYGLLGALILCVIIAAVTLLGTHLRDIFQYIADHITPPA